MVKNSKKGRGRPRTFDEMTAISMATNVFWAKGFDGATIDDLVDEMGVRRPSLYAIFGDKSTLFMRCLEAYKESLGSLAGQALFGPKDVHEAIRALLRFSVESATVEGSPLGCLMICVAPLVDDENVRRFLETATEQTLSAIVLRLRQGIEAGELPSHFPCEERSRMLLDISRGHVMRARMGAARQDLLDDATRSADVLLQLEG